MVIKACQAVLTECFRLMCKQRGRQQPHQQGTPPWEFPGSKQGPAWVPGNKEEPSLGSWTKAT
jgi:hypothetical protein